MSDNGGGGLGHLIRAWGYSMAGFRWALGHETAFRQEVLLAAVLVPVALWLGERPLEYALLVGSLLLVLVAELLNSGIEAAVDRVGEERHPLAGRAKDLGSAAVFLALVHGAVIWAGVALPNLLGRF